MNRIIAAVSVCIMLVHCGSSANKKQVAMNRETLKEKPYLAFLDSLLCDGFDYPFGDGNGGGNYTDKQTGKAYSGWYIATKTGEVYSLGVHTGEDWNGSGGGNTDLGQDVYSTAKGIVKTASNFGAPWGNIVIVEHHVLENNQVDTIFSVYVHLAEIAVELNTVVSKRQRIGSIGDGNGSYPAHLHFELRASSLWDAAPDFWPSSHGYDSKWVLQHYLEPSKFIETHRKIIVPSQEPRFVFVSKHDYKLYYFEKDSLKQEYDIALSQAPIGHKQKQGDLKLPEGMYFIVEKSEGPFTGDYSEYLGPRWMKLSYPNIYDAKQAHAEKRIDKKTFEACQKAWRDRSCPPQNTYLGGGIGIHGWAGDWPELSRDLTWGCISMKNEELKKFNALITLKTCVVVVP